LLNAERKKKYQVGVHNISENVEKNKADLLRHAGAKGAGEYSS
jgi:hypothetical protein